MSRKYDEKEKNEYVKDFKSSGKTLSKYALEKGLPKTTLFESENTKIELKKGFD